MLLHNMDFKNPVLCLVRVRVRSGYIYIYIGVRLRCVALCCAVCSSVALCCAVILCYVLFCCVVFCCVVCKAKSKDVLHRGNEKNPVLGGER
jgi:hypothetical protein